MVWTVNKLALYGKLLMPEYSAITRHTSPFCLVASPTFVLFHAAPDFMIHYNNWPCNPTMLNMSWIFKRRYYLGSHTKHMVGSPAFLLYWVHECGVVIQCRLLSRLFQGCDVHQGEGRMRQPRDRGTSKSQWERSLFHFSPFHHRL